MTSDCIPRLADDALAHPEKYDLKRKSRESMWEILVPTEKRLTPGTFYRTKYHQVWDAKVRAISGGLTIMQPAKGQWISPCGTLFLERMIPVRIIATREQIEQIVDMTMEYYDQLAVLCYKLSDDVILKHRE